MKCHFYEFLEVQVKMKWISGIIIHIHKYFVQKVSNFNFVTKCWFDIKRLLPLPTIRISCCMKCCLLHMPAFCSLAFWTICYLMMRGDLSLNMLGAVFAQYTHMLSFLENVFLKWISLHPVTSLHTHLYTFDDNQFHSYHHSTNAKSIWIVKKIEK